MGTERAAYGFRIDGIEDPVGLALDGAHGWPVLRVEQRIEASSLPPPWWLDQESASIPTLAGRLVLSRSEAIVSVRSGLPVSDRELVHPCLWPAAAVFARWRGAETFHAGAFAASSGAWAVLGDRGDGKSSLLAALALGGTEVLADDLLVVERRRCYAGPRAIDLRPEAAESLGARAQLLAVRRTERYRLSLPPAPGAMCLAGFVELAWGEAIGVESVSPAESFGLLARHRRIAGLGVELEQLFDLVRLPVFRLVRPRRASLLQDAVDALLDAIASDEPPLADPTFFHPAEFPARPRLGAKSLVDRRM